MFNFIEQTGQVDLARKAAMLLISTAVHAAVIVILILLPLIFIGAVPEVDLVSFLIAAPAPPPAPPPPPPPVKPEIRPEYKPVLVSGFKEPETVPKGVFPPAPNPTPGEFAAGPAVGIPGSAGFGNFDGISGSPLGGAVLEPPVPMPQPPPPPKQKQIEPVRRGGDVQQSKLIRRVDPEYPPLALEARVSGEVIMDVRVDEEGNVVSIRVLKGHQLLVDAARNAVVQWKYSPTILNGEPVPVVATVTVIFTLR